MSGAFTELRGILVDHCWIAGVNGIACRCGDELVSRHSSRKATIEDHVDHVATLLAARDERVRGEMGDDPTPARHGWQPPRDYGTHPLAAPSSEPTP